MSMTSPMMDLSGSVATDDNFQTCDSPSGSSTSEPHDDALPMQQPFIDQSFFYKLDQLSPDDPLYFMQQQRQQQQQQLQLLQQQQQQQQQQKQVANYQSSVSPSPPPSLSQSSIVDPLQPSSSTSSESNPTFWSGFNNIISNVANPLPQAIPNLTKNFTDYIAGYPIQQTNGDKISFKHDIGLPGMQIRVLGVPQTGAKSRVETQIKLCIQLVTDDGDKAQWWSHLKLPEHMVAKDKLKRQVILSPDGTSMTSIVAELDGANAPIPPEKIIFLKARVICASDPSRKVLTCLGCIQRERKRSQRRKENRTKSEQENKHILEDDTSLALEEQKILLFNCSEMVDFSSGDTILPTRITCYCRHHNERLGFCIYFEMQDHTGKQIATGMSPPIMITDDHKSNKLKSSRKRPRTEDNNSIGSSFDLRQISAGPLLPHHSSRFNHAANQSAPPFQIQPRLPDRSPNPSPVSPFRSPERVASPLPNPLVVDKPCLQRLIPNEGPTYGGVEITLLGSGFRSGLTVLFGEVPASSTHYWSPNTLVCILPPATEAGTVVVSFKEHPLVVDTQDVTLFTYYNENDRALMELALQVVGLKMTGKVEDAREIAMRIVQGGNGQTDSGMISHNNHTSLELHIIQILEVMSTFCDVEPADISIASAQGHTMLHLACMLGFKKLTKRLLQMGCDMDRTDRNGYTALHYCSWYNHLNVVKVILDDTTKADAEITNMWNKKPIHLTTDATIHQLLLNHSISDDDTDADADVSLEESEDEDTWLTDDTSSQEDRDPSYQSDSASEISVPNHHHHHHHLSEGLRHRKRNTNHKNISSYTNTASIQYLNPEESAGHSADDILDAEPLHSSDQYDQLTDYEDNQNKEEMTWVQRTLSHFQPAPNDTTSFLQNIKNNMPTKPSDLNLKTIAEHLLQLPRPASMIANMSVLFSNENEKTQQDEPDLAWYMALAYAMGSLTQEPKEDFPPQDTGSPRSSFEENNLDEIRARKRSDRRLYSFWVPMLCLMVIWLIYQFISSHPGVVDTILSISGFRRQYLTIH